MQDDPCPLATWFDETGESKEAFIERTGIGRTWLYDLLSGKYDDYGILKIAVIEDATKGRIKAKAMIEWLERKREKT